MRVLHKQYQGSHTYVMYMQPCCANWPSGHVAGLAVSVSTCRNATMVTLWSCCWPCCLSVHLQKCNHGHFEGSKYMYLFVMYYYCQSQSGYIYKVLTRTILSHQILARISLDSVRIMKIKISNENLIRIQYNLVDSYKNLSEDLPDSR